MDKLALRLSNSYNASMGNKTGPKPKRPDGYHVTASGYLRGRFDGRMRLVHVVIWERANGRLPDGWQVHHVNEDKQDNVLENLAAVSPTTHKRIHSGCFLRDGIWWKPCSICEQYKPIEPANWYISAAGYPLYGRCRPCHVARVVEEKRLRKLRRKTS